MTLKKRIDLKLGSDLRRRIGEVMIALPFCGAAVLALLVLAYHFPIPFLLIVGFALWFVVASWLADNY